MVSPRQPQNELGYELLTNTAFLVEEINNGDLHTKGNGQQQEEKIIESCG